MDRSEEMFTTMRLVRQSLGLPAPGPRSKPKYDSPRSASLASASFLPTLANERPPPPPSSLQSGLAER